MPLVLKRLLNEAVVIDGPATIRVVEIARGRVRLMIEADRSVKVLREEIVEQKERQEARPLKQHDDQWVDLGGEGGCG